MRIDNKLSVEVHDSMIFPLALIPTSSFSTECVPDGVRYDPTWV